MTKILFALLTSLCFACGASDEYLDEGDDALGSLEQPVVTATTPTYTLGATTADAALACNKTSIAQVCTVPESKSITYCVPTDSTFTTAFRSNITGAIGQVDASTLFGFTSVPPNSSGACAGNSDWVFTSGNVSGTLSSNIEGYVKAGRSKTADLTDTGVPGSFQTHLGCVITLDAADIVNKTAGGGIGSQGKLQYHAALNGIAKCMGIGSRSDTGCNNKACERSVVEYTSQRTPFTSGQICMLNAYTPAGMGSSPGQYVQSGSCAND